MPPGAAEVRLLAQLESDEFPRYVAALIDPGAGRTLWRSGPLRVAWTGAAKSLVVTIPAASLSAQHYTLQISGIPDRGAPEIVTSYRFNVVVK